MVKEVPCCQATHYHEESVSNVRSLLPDEIKLYDLAELFKIFGDSTRIRILYVLLEREVCVCDIANILDMSVSAISHQLRVLKQSRLVKYKKVGKTVYYSLSDEHVHTILQKGMEHVEE